MDSSSEEFGASLAESGQQIGGSETTGLSHLDTGFLEFQNLEVDAGEILEPRTNLDFADLLGLPDDNAGYSPSVCTDFSWFLPETSVETTWVLQARDYNQETWVLSAWKILSAENFKLLWGRSSWVNFWT